MQQKGGDINMDKKKMDENPEKQQSVGADAESYIFVRYITRNGKRIYPKNTKFFKIPTSRLKKQ